MNPSRKKQRLSHYPYLDYSHWTNQASMLRARWIPYEPYILEYICYNYMKGSICMCVMLYCSLDMNRSALY